MLRAMLRVGNFLQSSHYGETGVGKGGPIGTLINHFIPSQQEYFISTMERLGIKSNLDSLGGNPLGGMFQPSNIRRNDYRRIIYSHNPGYDSVSGRNLHVLTNVRVRKFILYKIRECLSPQA
jgi:hypothetical protein